MIEKKGIRLHGAPMYLDMQASRPAARSGRLRSRQCRGGGGGGPSATGPLHLPAAHPCLAAWLPGCRPPPRWTPASSTPCCPS